MELQNTNNPAMDTTTTTTATTTYHHRHYHHPTKRVIILALLLSTFLPTLGAIFKSFSDDITLVAVSKLVDDAPNMPKKNFSAVITSPPKNNNIIGKTQQQHKQHKQQRLNASKKQVSKSQNILSNTTTTPQKGNHTDDFKKKKKLLASQSDGPFRAQYKKNMQQYQYHSKDDDEDDDEPSARVVTIGPRNHHRHQQHLNTTTTQRAPQDESRNNKANQVMAVRSNPKQALYDRVRKKTERYDNDLNGESFSACILIKDENHRLPEWLAYHYFALPLRKLIVLIDPHSTKSPRTILQRWRPLMNITIWTDRNIGFKPIFVNKTVHVHRNRQLIFYKKCSNVLRNQNRTWTGFFDVDEYIRINDFVPNATERSQQPGHILRLIQDPLPDTRSLIHNESSTCIQVYRRAFGANENNNNNNNNTVPSEPADHDNKNKNNNGQVGAVLPDFVNTTRFETLRFQYRAHDSSAFNGSPKGLLDVRYAPDSTNDEKWIGIHQLVKPACKRPRWRRRVLVINHYRGSAETYFSRADARRSQEAFDKYQSEANHQVDDGIRPWIGSFVKLVGIPLAKQLLRGAGQLT